MLSRLEPAARQNLRHTLAILPTKVPAAQLSTLQAHRAQVTGVAGPSAPSCSRWESRNASSKATKAPLEEDIARMPRFLRRQALQRVTANTKGTAAGNQQATGMKLLDPYILAKRLRALCADNKLDDAVSMLKTSPRDAMNAVVWNTMIWESLKVRRFQLAYRLYVDMKRRGLSPTTRTFQTMFTGISKIESWSSHAQQLSNARLLYDAFQRHITSLKKHEPDSPDISAAPLAAYIKILGDNGQYNEIFDVYDALDGYGNFTADANIYSAMFTAMANTRRVLTEKNITPPETWELTVAADARELWMKLDKGSRDGPSPNADPFVAMTAISALTKGSKKDKALAFDIVEKYFGLSCDPNKASLGYFSLHPAAFGAVLKLCNEAGDYTSCISFLQQVKERPSAQGGLAIIDRMHVEEVLKARFAKASKGSKADSRSTADSHPEMSPERPALQDILDQNPQKAVTELGRESLGDLQWMLRQERAGHGGHIRPATSTYTLVFNACWKANDWASAATAFELMTGYASKDFEGPVSRLKRRAGQNLTPSAESMSALVRTALSTRQLRYIQQSLRMVDHVGIDHVYVGSGAKLKRDAKTNLFYGKKLALAAEEALKLLQAYKDECVPSELATWRAFVAKCKEAFAKSDGEGYKPTNLKLDPEAKTKRTEKRGRLA